jgi:hypothetical protein
MGTLILRGVVLTANLALLLFRLAWKVMESEKDVDLYSKGPSTTSVLGSTYYFRFLKGP